MVAKSLMGMLAVEVMAEEGSGLGEGSVLGGRGGGGHGTVGAGSRQLGRGRVWACGVALAKAAGGRWDVIVRIRGR